jgi:hypothetical protein
MVFTRADGKLALAHVITKVFELPAAHVMNTALNQAGIVEIGNILSMPYDDIMELSYIDADGNEQPGTV